MSMHLEGPWLSTTGKKKGKKKFASAEHARKAREQAEAWEELLKKHSSAKPVKANKQTLTDVYKLSIPADRNVRNIPSLCTGQGNATLKPSKVYTGTKVKGIATMHKSNAVPVFSNEEAQDISKMRR